MNTEQLRAEFEEKFPVPDNCQWCGDGYAPTEFNAWEAKSYADKFKGWMARAALQSQSNHDTTLFCDLKTDEEKSAFFLSGRGYETGVIAQAIQNDVAMAYLRCAEYKKELEAMQSQYREDAERYRWIAKQKDVWAVLGDEYNLASEYEGANNLTEAIDHARNIVGGKDAISMD